MGKQPYSSTAKAASSAVQPGFARLAVATVALAVMLAVFFSAGFWQLDRAEQKNALLRSFAQAIEGASITALVDDTQAHSVRFRTFSLQGRYLPERQILLDNMTDGGANGYQVLTPFQTDRGYVLVNRGWLAANNDRRIFPNIAVADNQRTIVARLNALPAPGLRLGGQDIGSSGWPRRLLFPDHQQLELVLDLELPDYQLQLEPTQEDGYLRAWQAVSSGPEKHLGYAMQWFSFATLAVIFYVILIFQWRRSRKTSVHTQSPTHHTS